MSPLPQNIMNLKKDMMYLQLELDYAELSFEEKEEIEKELEKTLENYKELRKKELAIKNRYDKKLTDKRKNEKLKNITWMYVGNKVNDNNKKYLKRVYYSDRRKYANKFSEKKVRNYKGTIPNGGSYRKLYPY